MIKDMASMMKQMQKIQEKMQEVQNELEGLTVTGEAGGGMVKVTASGKQRIIKVEIDHDLLKPDDADMASDLIVAATNQALENAAKLAQERLSGITGGMLGDLGMGGLSDFLPK